MYLSILFINLYHTICIFLSFNKACHQQGPHTKKGSEYCFLIKLMRNTVLLLLKLMRSTLLMLKLIKSAVLMLNLIRSIVQMLNLIRRTVLILNLTGITVLPMLKLIPPMLC